MQPYEPTLTPEQEEFLEKYREAVRQCEFKADSISAIYNQEYNYTIPIHAYFDKKSPMNCIISDFELFILDLPYYGMCDSTKTKGFIYTLHFPENIIDIKIYKGCDGYSAFGGWYEFNVKLK